MLLIGLDGADLKVMRPLLAAGKLPNIKSIVDGGIAVPLASQSPMWSPCLWTTIATGKNREKHGILDFEMIPAEGRKPVLVNANFRKTAALWNMVSQSGKTVGFLGWWASFPAERVNGFILTDRVAHTRFKSWSTVPDEEFFHLSDPPSLAQELSHLVRNPGEISTDELLALAPFTAEELAEIQTDSPPTLYHGFSVVRYAQPAESTYVDLACHLLDTKEQPDLIGVFLVGIDPISHCFWEFREPGRVTNGPSVPPEDAARFGSLIDGYYAHVDHQIGKILQRIDETTNVIIVSDHGFRASGHRTEPEKFQSGVHDRAGVLIASGPSIKKASTVYFPSILDITPTVLALLGLPAGADMDGRVLREILTPEQLEDFPLTTIQSHDDEFLRSRLRAESPGEARYLEHLRTLGYLGENRPDGEH